MLSDLHLPASLTLYTKSDTKPIFTIVNSALAPWMKNRIPYLLQTLIVSHPARKTILMHCGVFGLTPGSLLSEELYGAKATEEMRMKIVLPDGSRKEMIVESTSIENLLKELGINHVEVIVAKNGKIVSEEETVGFADELKIVRVVHGG
jgi:sulfur carrier protein